MPRLPPLALPSISLPTAAAGNIARAKPGRIGGGGFSSGAGGSEEAAASCFDLAGGEGGQRRRSTMVDLARRLAGCCGWGGARRGLASLRRTAKSAGGDAFFAPGLAPHHEGSAVVVIFSVEGGRHVAGLADLAIRHLAPAARRGDLGAGESRAISGRWRRDHAVTLL